jgi:ribosomal protein S6--L-glutamate ligase
MIIRSKKAIEADFDCLGAGDIMVGELTLANQKAALLVDLMQRGVICIPSPLAQLLSRSKTAQAGLLKAFMHPLTRSILRRKDLLDAINEYNQADIGPVVTKQDHLHCGHGVRRWDHIEMLYSFCGLDKTVYPFVLQPFIRDFTDVRVIMVGDYEEAYVRSNPANFRGNLSAGGEHRPFDLSADQRAFCRRVIERAGFPYAHLDLQVLNEEQCYLQEIAFNGGIRGSALTRPELDTLKQAHLEALAAEVERASAGSNDLQR